MSEHLNKNEKKVKPILKWLAVAVLVVTLICAMWVNFGIRAPIEAADDTVGLFVDYDELWRIANTSQDMEFREMMQKAYDAGATGIIVRERVLAEWEIAGDLIALSGGQFRFQLEAMHSESIEWINRWISPDGTYILTRDPLVYEQIFQILEAKERFPVAFEFQDYRVIGTNLHSVERGNLGLGFPLEQLEMAAEIGFYILPRIRTWEPVTEQSLATQMYWIDRIPNLIAVGFNDSTMPGGGLDPDIQELIADAIAPLDKPLVSFEFFNQTGLIGLAQRLDSGFLRVHAIAENELTQLREFQDAANRLNLAATERNMRIIYLRFHSMANPASSLEHNLEFIEYIRESLESTRMTVGTPVPLPDFSIPFLALIIVGIGVISAGLWLAWLTFEPFMAKKTMLMWVVIILVFGTVAWVGGLIFMPSFVRKFFALAAAILFPVLGIILILQNRDKWLPFLNNPLKADGSGICNIKKILRAAVHLIIMSLCTLAGGIIMSSLLSEPDFMVKLNTFVGVSISHVIPLFLIPIILWLREEDWYGIMHGTVKSNVKIWQFGLCFVMFAAFALFMMRTGNDNPDAVLDIELRIRQILHNILGVRPRTSEFLIGHPFMLVLLYYGYKLKMFPLVIVGTMGQVSIMNTYAHVHTPILVSVARTLQGLWLGIVIGVIMIIVLEFIIKKMKALKDIREANLGALE